MHSCAAAAKSEPPCPPFRGGAEAIGQDTRPYSVYDAQGGGVHDPRLTQVKAMASCSTSMATGKLTGRCPSAVNPVQAIRILHEEHLSLDAVLHGLLYLVHEIRSYRTEPDFALLGAMVYYIDTFPERFHHPKEDAWLFRRIVNLAPPPIGVGPAYA